MMKKIEDICRKYNIALCYLFGSQKEAGLAQLAGDTVKVSDTNLT